uniref:Arrestin domain-containing protein 3-like n=1 Tax=Diabrotica virgifera virgifera TaxID=50390 RepID=A0A6P7EZR7_DIAVI
MSCNIILNKPRVFHPRDNINGRVVVSFDHEEHIEGIRCSFRGREQVHWTEQKDKAIVHVGAQSDFLVQNIVLVGEEGYMKPGAYEYQFSFTLPSGNIPSPFVEEFGSIRYLVQAKVDRASKVDYKDEYEIKFEVPTTQYVELSQNEQLTYQVGKEINKNEYAAMFLILESDTYVLGNEMSFTVELKNRSRLKIRRIQADLSLNIQFISPGPPTKCKIHKIPITMVEDEGEQKGYTRLYNLKLKIPPDVLLPNFGSCDLLKYWCTLKIEALLPSPHTNLILEKNIKLGHVAIDSKKKYVPSAPPITDVHLFASGHIECVSEINPNPIFYSNEQVGPNNTDKDAPPPSYDEVIKQ